MTLKQRKHLAAPMLTRVPAKRWPMYGLALSVLAISLPPATGAVVPDPGYLLVSNGLEKNADGECGGDMRVQYRMLPVDYSSRTRTTIDSDCGIHVEWLWVSPLSAITLADTLAVRSISDDGNRARVEGAIDSVTHECTISLWGQYATDEYDFVDEQFQLPDCFYRGWFKKIASENEYQFVQALITDAGGKDCKAGNTDGIPPLTYVRHVRTDCDLYKTADWVPEVLTSSPQVFPVVRPGDPALHIAVDRPAA